MTGVNIKVRADARQAQNEMRKLNASMQSIDKQARNVTRTFQKLAIGITAAFAGSAVTKGITNASDSMTNFRNRVNLVTQDVGKTQVVMKELFDIAARSRGSVDAAAETFNRFGLALQDADKPLSELLVVTEAVQQAAVISGSGAESAKAAIVQLGQGLASGELRGQELNSVLEQMPRLARAIADGMGIPFGKLREEAMAGQVTAEAVYAAILSGAADIDAEFSTLDATTSGLFVVLKNEFTRAIAEMDKVIGVSSRIKDAILIATRSVRYFGQNIGDWAFILGSELLIAKSEVIFFTRDVKRALGDLFSGSLDGSALAQSVVDALENVRIKAKEKIDEISLSITTMLSGFTPEAVIPKAIDLSTGLFTGLEAAKVTISSFVKTIAGYFYGLWKSVVGKSTWTGIFDQNHEEGDAKAIGNTSHWKGLLDATSKMIGKWTGALAGVFVTLNKNITTQWANLVEYVNGLGFEAVDYTSLSSGFDSVLANLRTAWDSFYDFLTTKEIGTLGGLVKVETEFSKTLGRMKEGYDNLFKTLFSSNQGTDYEVAAGLVPEASESELLTSLKGRVDSISAALAATPIVIGVKVLAEGLVTNLDDIKDNITGFFDSNANIMSAAITSSIFLALKPKLRTMLLGPALAAAFITAAGQLGNNSGFLDAARNTAKGFGEALNKMLTGEGDFVANTLTGLGNLAKAIGEGLLEGLFGTEFQDGFKSQLATALGVVITAFILTPKIALGMTKIATGLLAKLVLGLSVAAFSGFKKKLKDGLSTAILEVQTNPGRAAGAARSLGSKLATAAGAGMSAALSGVLAQRMADVAIPDDALGGVGEALDGAIGGAVAGAQLGLAFGPIGAAVGAAVGGAVGFAFDVYNNPELKQKFTDIAQAAKNWFLDLPETVGNAVTSGFEMAWEYLAGKLATIKDFFNFGEGTSSANNQRNPEGRTITGYDTSSGEPIYKAAGGYISGPGTGTSDDIPAMLSNGEYVMKASAVSKFGPGFMAKINAGIMPQKFSRGGLVGIVDRLENQYNSKKADLDEGRGSATHQSVAALYARLQTARQRLAAFDSQLNGGSSSSSSSSSKGKKGKGGKKTDGETAAEQFATNFKEDFKSGLSQFLRTGDIKEFLTGLLDSFTGSIIDSFVEGFTEKLLGKATGEGGWITNLFQGGVTFGENVAKTTSKSVSQTLANQSGEGGILSSISGFFGKMFEGIKGLFSGGGASGGGGGGLFSSIFGKSFGSIFGFSQGGVVPSTPFSQAGKDSVPAMLMPGEVVLSKNDVARQNMNQGQQQQVFNINVSGDVSRQTRQEIVKMMPQITSGVNMNNKENNFRRS